MSDILTVLYQHPEYVTLLTNDCYLYPDNFLDFVLYNPEYHRSYSRLESVLKAVCEVFYVHNTGSFRPLTGQPTYPSLIHLNYCVSYHGVMAYLSEEEVVYLDYNDTRIETYQIRTMTGQEAREWIEKFRNPTIGDIEEFFHVDCEDPQVRMNIAEISYHRDLNELSRILSQRSDSIIGFAVNNPDMLYSIQPQYDQIDDPIIQELLVDKSPEIDAISRLQLSIRRVTKEKINTLKQEILQYQSQPIN